MKRYFLHLSALIPALVLILAVAGFLVPQTAHAQAGVVKTLINLTDIGTDILLAPLGWLATLILQVATLLTYLSGIILNYVVIYTVVEMKENLGNVTAIDNAWSTIRDVANMGFIFVLLYAAIQTILGIGGDNKKLIVNIIVAAILINFSLFFTKVVIDISNLLAVTFYDAIAPGALSTQTVSLGLSNSLMEPLRITSLWDANEIAFQGKTLIIIGVMGTIVSLIAAFIFFTVSILFVIRFVVLIFVLILSPIAFMSAILPQLKKYKDQWQEALIGQAFFAPIYFMLTWIVIVVSRGILPQGGSMAAVFGGLVGESGETIEPNESSIGVLVNFIIMIALLIASIVISKDWAGKAGGSVGKLTSWATGAAGGLALGGAGRLGRNTFGRFGSAIGGSERLKEAASRGGAGGMAARLALATGRKTSGASFDLRGTGLAGQLDAGKGQKGGFAQTLKDKRKNEKEFADSLGASDELIAEKERVLEKTKAARARAQAAVVGAETAHGRDSDQFREAALSLNRERSAADAAQREVDRLKGVDDKEALKRIKRENAGISNEDAQARLDADKELPVEARRYAIKGIKDIRKEQRVESLENSPTYKAAAALEKSGQKIAGTAPAQAISGAAGMVAGGLESAAESVKRTTDVFGLRTLGKAASGVLKAPVGATRLTRDSVLKIPTMVRAKNRAAIAEIRKGKKPVREYIKEIIEAEEGTREAIEEAAEAQGGGAPPAAGTPPIV